MRNYISGFHILVLTFIFPSVVAVCRKSGSSPDLPYPPSTMKTFQPGTWIVPMDNKQYDSNGNFNLAAYGFIYRCLWADVDVYWIIKGCKGVDGVDFTASARKVLPLWNEVPHYNEDFKYGAFAIPDAYLAYKSYEDLALAAAELDIEPPHVFELELTTTLEVRHTWTVKPKVAVLGSKANYHTTILKKAGLIEGVHYAMEKQFDQESCYSFVSNAHDGLEGEESRSLRVAEFLHMGGNFLAQCKAARSYGMYAAHHGFKFLLTTPDAGKTIGSDDIPCTMNLKYNYSYPYCPALSDGKKKWNNNGKVPFGTVQNPDLPYMQFAHSKGFNYAVPGSWASGDIESIEGYYNPSTAFYDLSNSIMFKTMAGKITGYDNGPIGGMIYYMAGHKYGSDCKEPLCSMNAYRMYMNAAITPSVPKIGCDHVLISKSLVRCQNPTNNQSNTWCDDGLAPQYCNWDLSCESLPSCINFRRINEDQLSCVPDYCNNCEAIWKNQVTGETVTCSEGVRGYVDRCATCTVNDGYNQDCCSSTHQCALNEGDCDKDTDCQPGLICGQDNCGVGWPASADCCTIRTASPTREPTFSPTPAPTRHHHTREPTKFIREPDICVDVADWEDIQGNDCSDYEANIWCRDGYIINEEIATTTSVDGINASQACCVCSNITDFPIIIVFRVRLPHLHLRANTTFQNEFRQNIADLVGIPVKRVSIFSIEKDHNQKPGWSLFAIKITPSTRNSETKTQAVYNDIMKDVTEEDGKFFHGSATKYTDGSYTPQMTHYYPVGESATVSQGASTVTVVSIVSIIFVLIASAFVWRKFQKKKRENTVEDYINFQIPDVTSS